MVNNNYSKYQSHFPFKYWDKTLKDKFSVQLNDETILQGIFKFDCGYIHIFCITYRSAILTDDDVESLW